MNRRTFLAMGAAAAVAASGRAGAQDKIRCGLLGVDHAHGIDALEVLLASPDYEVIGVCEPEAAVRSAFADRIAALGVKWVDEAALLGDASVRMVAVESGVPRLLDLAQQAVDAGKHIHLDKPAGTSLDALAKLHESAAKQDLLIQMGYMFRYNPGFDLMRQAVHEGWLGDIYAVHTSMCTDIAADKRSRMAFHPGGMMLELGCHLIDMIHLIVGEPETVRPTLRHDGPFDDGLADNTFALFEYPNAIATVEVAAMEPGAFAGRRFKVSGTKGTMVLEPLEPPKGRLALREAAGGYAAGSHMLSFPDTERHVRDFADLAAAIRGEKAFEYTLEHDFAVQRTVLRASGVAV